jgi:translocation and assembly module TamB
LSAAPQFPPDYRLPEELPRRRKWRRIAAWTAGILAGLILLVVIAVYVLLHSSAVHRYVLQQAQQRATAALGTHFQLREYKLTFSGISPTLELYNVTINGADPYPTPPLLQVDHIGASVRVTSLLRRTWYLNDIRMDHPVVRVFVDKRGTDNLPQTKKTSTGESKTDIFALGARHAQLNDGEVYYNNRKSAMNADLHDLMFQAAFDAAKQSYSGSLEYRDGHLTLGAYNPMPHNLNAQFSATRQMFALERAVLSSGRSQFTLKATVEDYAQPRVQATYDASLDSGEFRRIMKNPTLPAGVINMNGSMNYVSRPNVAMMAALVLNGGLSSRALRVETPSFQGDITNIGALYTVAKGNLEVRDMRANLLGGQLTGTMTMSNFTGDAPRSRLQANLRGVSLAELKTLMASPSLKQVALSGGVNATADAAWGKTFDNLVARTDANLNARIAAANGAAGVPLTGVVHARYAAASKQIALSQSYLRTPQTSVTLDGTVSDRSALQVRMQSQNLHELETVANIMQPPAAGQQPLGLYGTASFVGTVRGSTSAPQVTGQLNAQNLKVRNSSWRVLRTNVSLSPSQASLQNGFIQPADRGRITFNISAGLRQWSLTDNSPFQVALNASNLNAAGLAQLAGSQAPVTGTLNAEVALHGTQLNPIGNGNISLTNAKLSGETIQSLNVKFNGTGDAVRTNLALRIPAGAAEGVATIFPNKKEYQANLQAHGIRLDRLQTLKARNMNVAGVLNMDATGQGRFDNPQLSANISTPQLRVENQTINALTMQANIANHVANAALDSQAINTALRVRGTVQLTGDYYANATIDTQPIPLGPLAAMYAPSQAGNISGQTELHATLRGPLKNKALLDAHAVIPTLRVNYKNTVQVGATSPIHIDYVNGVLNLQRTSISGTGTNLQLQGSVPLVNRAAPVSLLLQGNVDLQIAQLFNPDIASSGQLQFNINSFGQRANPDVQGQIRVVNASIATGDAPLGLQNGNGVLTLTKDRLDVTQFQGTVGGGSVSAHGGIVYRPEIRFDLGMSGTNVRLLYPDGVRQAFDLDLAFAGTLQNSQLGGQVRLTQLAFTPDFDLMEMMGSFSDSVSPPPSPGFTDNLKLNIAVQSTGGVNLVSRELTLQASANLRVQGTVDRPVILGRINLSSGDLIFQGNRYILQGGFIDFVSPYETKPVLNVRVDTTIQQYNIHMMFRGPVDHLQTSYTSDPSLPPPDIINLIAFGKTTEASAANPTPPGTLGAQSLIASQVSGQVTSRISKIAGISQLSVDPVLAGSNQRNPGARLTVQQRVTGNIFVTFSTDVTSTQDQTIQLQYKVSPRLSISGTRDQNGGFGFDTIIQKKW